MKLHRENAYPVAPGVLYGVFTDRAYYESALARGGDEWEFVEFGPRGKAFVVNTRRHIRLRNSASVPALARKFVREVNVMHTVSEWTDAGDGRYTGRYSFEFEGVPVTIAGRLRIEPRGAGCVHLIDVDVDCSIPLIGGKIAAMMAERAEKSMLREYEEMCAWLRAQGHMVS
jgi:hypothetical protein